MSPSCMINVWRRCVACHSRELRHRKQMFSNSESNSLSHLANKSMAKLCLWKLIVLCTLIGDKTRCIPTTNKKMNSIFNCAMTNILMKCKWWHSVEKEDETAWKCDRRGRVKTWCPNALNVFQLNALLSVMHQWFQLAVHLWCGLRACDSIWEPRPMVQSAGLHRPLTSASLFKIYASLLTICEWINSCLLACSWGYDQNGDLVWVLCFLADAGQVWNDEITRMERCRAWCHCQSCSSNDGEWIGLLCSCKGCCKCSWAVITSKTEMHCTKSYMSFYLLENKCHNHETEAKPQVILKRDHLSNPIDNWVIIVDLCAAAKPRAMSKNWHFLSLMVSCFCALTNLRSQSRYGSVCAAKVWILNPMMRGQVLRLSTHVTWLFLWSQMKHCAKCFVMTMCLLHRI